MEPQFQFPCPPPVGARADHSMICAHQAILDDPSTRCPRKAVFHIRMPERCQCGHWHAFLLCVEHHEISQYPAYGINAHAIAGHPCDMPGTMWQVYRPRWRWQHTPLSRCVLDTSGRRPPARAQAHLPEAIR